MRSEQLDDDRGLPGVPSGRQAWGRQDRGEGDHRGAHGCSPLQLVSVLLRIFLAGGREASVKGAICSRQRPLRRQAVATVDQGNRLGWFSRCWKWQRGSACCHPDRREARTPVRCGVKNPDASQVVCDLGGRPSHLNVAKSHQGRPRDAEPGVVRIRLFNYIEAVSRQARACAAQVHRPERQVATVA